MKRPKHNKLKIMDKEDIKIGETYYTPAKVIGINQYNQPKVHVLNHDIYCFPHELRPSPSEPPTLVGPTPKHDPCRKFHKGDKVRLIKWNGRNPFDTHHGLKLNPGEVHIVLDDEYDRNEVYIGMSAADEEQSVVHSCNLELITPAEELEPYYVDKWESGWTVNKKLPNGDFYITCSYEHHHPHAKEAAEAECARLNAKHREGL